MKTTKAMTNTSASKERVPEMLRAMLTRRFEGLEQDAGKGLEHVARLRQMLDETCAIAGDRVDPVDYTDASMALHRLHSIFEGIVESTGADVVASMEGFVADHGDEVRPFWRKNGMLKPSSGIHRVAKKARAA